MTRKHLIFAALVCLLPLGCAPATPETAPGAERAPLLAEIPYRTWTDRDATLADVQIRVRRIEARLDDLLREADASVERGPR